MKIKRILLTLLTVALLLGAFAGCTEAADEREKQTAEKATADENKEEIPEKVETIELEFYIWDDEEAYIADVAERYNESQSNASVNLTVVPSAEYDDKLKVILASGTDVDIVDIRGISQVATFAENGALYDITDMVSESGLDTDKYGPQWKTSDYEGSYYALPTRSTCWVLYYNADIFDQAGIPYPDGLTWEQYAEVALEIKEKTGVYGGFFVTWVMPFAAIQQGVYVNDEDTTALEYTLELFNRFYNIDESHMSYEEMTGTNADFMGEFESGRAAMLPNGEWCVQMLLEDEAAGEIDMNWQIASMPVPEGTEPGTTWGQFQFASINAFSDHPEAAFDFLSYLCGEEGAEIYSQHGMIHAYSGEGAIEAYQEVVGKESASVLFESKKIQEQPNDPGYNEVNEAFREHAELYLIGEKTLEETIENFVSQRDEIMADFE